MNAVLSLLRNTFFSVIISLFNRLGNTILFIFVIQRLGVVEGGVYDLGVTFFFLASRFAFWGLDHLLTREVAKDRSQLPNFVTNFLYARIGLGILTIIGFGLVVGMLDYERDTQWVIWLMLLGVLPETINNLCWGVFAACEQVHLATLSTFLNGVVKIVGGIILINQGGTLPAIVGILLVGHVSAMILNLILIRRYYLSQWLLPDLIFIREQMRVAVPFMFISMFFILDNRLDKVLLSLLSDEQAVGFYGSATTIIIALSMLSEGYRVAILPVLARFRERDENLVYRLYHYSFKLLLLISLPLSVAVVLLAEGIITLLYHRTMPIAVTELQIMGVGIVSIYLTVLNHRLFIVYNRQDLIARFLTITVALNVLCNLWLIPIWGGIGAAIGRTLSLLVLLLLAQIMLPRFIPRLPYGALLGRPLLCSAGMGVAIWYTTPWGFGWQIVIGVLTYGCLLIVTGAIAKEDLLILRQLFRGKTDSLQQP